MKTHFFVFFLALCSITEAAAHPMIEYWQNRTGSHAGFTLEPRVGYFTSSSNFDPTTPVNLPSNGTLTQTQFDLNGNLGLTDDFFIFGRLSVLSTKSQAPNTKDRTGMGLSDQLMGAAYRLLNSDGGSSVNLQGDIVLPGYSNTTSLANGNSYLGDGSTDFTGGLFAELPVKFIKVNDLYTEFGVGYTYRSKGFSAAIPWSALLKHDPAVRGFIFVAGLQGQQSRKTDIATNNTANLTQINSDRISGSYGSMIIDAVNPSWMSFRGSMGYKNGNGQTLYATLINPMSGTSLPIGMSISIGAILDFGPHDVSREVEEESAPRPKKSSRKTNKAPEDFASYDLDAEVTSVNDQLYLLKINKGSADNIEKGQIFDIFSNGKAVARAKVTHLKSSEAALTVVEYYQDHWIEVGSVAKRLVQ